MTAPVDPTPPSPAPGPLPADPDKYDAPRNVAARARGLPAPYIAGGDDPELRKTLREERRYVQLLVGMIVAIVALGFTLGIIGAIAAALLAS